MIEALQAFDGGYCRQLLALIDRRSWRIVRFPAVFFALRHKTEGWVLVDTGYGGSFHEASKHLPHRLYRWATLPKEDGRTTAALRASGIEASEIRHVIVTHFHGDHVGGLAEFPQATVHYHAEALESLQRLPAWRQARHAFLPALVPEWLPGRVAQIAARAFVQSPDLPFGSYDLFGDESVRLVSLPGHAPGHLGVLFTHGTRRELYAADAFWRRCQIVDGVRPLGMAMAFQWDPCAYQNTVRLLRDLLQRGDLRITACHDEGTRASLNGPPAAS